MVEALQLNGVRCVFGLPGTQTVDLFEALRQRGLRTVIATNELNAAFMAGGWARVTGEPGVLLTINGPGFTWALTGVAEARLDSIALVHVTGALAPSSTGRSFRQQELPQAAVAAPLVKGIVNADSYPDPALAVSDALSLARSGEPGPVLLQASPATFGTYLETGALALVSPSGAKNPELQAICARVGRARRPVLLVGQGTNRYAAQVGALVDRLHAPLITTPSARGVLPENHALHMGFDPLAGNVRELNSLLGSADLVLAIGCKLGHSGSGGFALQLPQDRLIHLDASEEVIHANYPASLGVVGDAGELLNELLDSGAGRSEWSDAELADWRNRIQAHAPDITEPRIDGTIDGEARSFFDALRKALPHESILVLDSGLHQILARRYYSVFAPCGLLMPTDLQSMGFAIPTAIGASIAMPNRPVVALVGDGGFAMTALELISAVRERIPLIVIIFADGAFGQIRVQQLANYGASHGVTLLNPDFHLLAASVGAHYEVISRNGDIESLIRTALTHSGVTVIEVGVRDSLPIRRIAVAARAREATRRAVGPRLLRFLLRLIRRGR